MPQSEEPINLKAAEAVGDLAWLIAQEFERAFDDIFLEIVRPEEKPPEGLKTKKAGGGK